MALSQSSSTAPAAPQQLGWQARLRWVHGICQGLPKVARQLDEFLSNQSSAVSTAKEMQEWREAWVGFQQNKDAWLQAGAQALQQAARKPPSGGAESNASGSAPLTFELLSDDVVENRILASRMALAMGETLQPGFEAMRLRIQALEGHELASRDMFRAETVCLHLVEQWLSCGMERKHLLRAVEPLQNALAPLMESEYSILHKLLDAKGVSKAQDARCACDVPRVARPPVPCIWAPAVAMAMRPMRVGPTLPCSTCRPVWLPVWASGLGWLRALPCRQAPAPAWACWRGRAIARWMP